MSSTRLVRVGDRRYSVHAVAYDLNDQPANGGQLYVDRDTMDQAREWAHRLFRQTGPFTVRDPQIGKVVAHGREMVFTGGSWSPAGARATVKGTVETVTRDVPVELSATDLALHCYDTTVMGYFERVHPRRSDGSCQCGQFPSRFAVR